MEHQPLTAFPDPHHALFFVASLAADNGIASDRAPVVLNGALVEFYGLPAHDLYLTRRGGVWFSVPSAAVVGLLESGALVVGV